jgi:osomolarity two-component system response regulator SKN7
MFVAAPDMNASIAVMNDAVGMQRMGMYPSGQTSALDAFHADPIQAMPYPVAQNTALEAVASGAVSDTSRVDSSPPAEKFDEWGPRKPHVFLVEDDKICSKIGTKFLRSLGCTVELAVRIQLP